MGNAKKRLNFVVFSCLLRRIKKAGGKKRQAPKGCNITAGLRQPQQQAPPQDYQKTAR
jgi:hypothetical protein